MSKGGRKQNPRTFVTENQPECDRWVAEIRSIKVANSVCFVFALFDHLDRLPMRNASACRAF